jgi:transcriptional regulator with XRE-family HTH domain
MKRQNASALSPAALATARHFGVLVRQARLARRWTVAELAERAGVSQATLKRLEKGAASASLGLWLAVFERLGLLPRVMALRDPASEALLNETRARRGRRSRADADLDF